MNSIKSTTPNQKHPICNCGASMIAQLAESSVIVHHTSCPSFSKPNQEPTPICDKAKFNPALMPPAFNLSQEVVQLDVAIRLERETIQLRKQLDEFTRTEPIKIRERNETRKERDQLRQELESAREDAKLLDWLDNTYNRVEFYISMSGETDIRKFLKEAIRQSLKQQESNK